MPTDPRASGNHNIRLDDLKTPDLILYRDAVVTACAAARAGSVVRLCGETAKGDLLTWLGIPFEHGGEENPSFYDLIRKFPPGEGTLLLDGSELPSRTLEEYRAEGYLGVTLFAALLRSSYGGDENGFFPTLSEMASYYEPSQLRTEPLRWDEEYLVECQEYFFEELTPAELLEQSLSLLPANLREQSQSFESELLSLAFLIGEQVSTLRPLSLFLTGFLSREEPFPKLSEFLATVSDWTQDSVRQSWDNLICGPEPVPLPAFLAPFSHCVPEILAASGPKLLRWRVKD